MAHLLLPHSLQIGRGFKVRVPEVCVRIMIWGIFWIGSQQLMAIHTLVVIMGRSVAIVEVSGVVKVWMRRLKVRMRCLVVSMMGTPLLVMLEVLWQQVVLD